MVNMWRRPAAAAKIITVGIMTTWATSLDLIRRWHEPADVVRAMFYGLGADGTVK
jgi:hypothetical protein